MAENILSLDAKEALDFFLKSEQYHGFELPEYFVFDELLHSVKKAIEDIPYEDCLQGDIRPEQFPDVNLDILLNKDGRYAVRPIMLANPFLYYFLVRELCSNRMRSCTECVDKLRAREDSGLGLIVSHNLKLAPFIVSLHDG